MFLRQQDAAAGIKTNGLFMANTKSAQKAHHQSLRKKSHNLMYKNSIRSILRDIKKFAFNKKVDEAKKLIPKFYKMLDKAAKEKVIKKNTASRKKSRVTKMIAKIQA